MHREKKVLYYKCFFRMHLAPVVLTHWYSLFSVFDLRQSWTVTSVFSITFYWTGELLFWTGESIWAPKGRFWVQGLGGFALRNNLKFYFQNPAFWWILRVFIRLFEGDFLWHILLFYINYNSWQQVQMWSLMEDKKNFL